MAQQERARNDWNSKGEYCMFDRVAVIQQPSRKYVSRILDGMWQARIIKKASFGFLEKADRYLTGFITMIQ